MFVIPPARRLWRDRSGTALVEFALSLPIVLGLGCYAVETTNLALAHMRVSQIALNLADNAARVGDMQSDNSTQLREIDVNDTFAAARMQGAPWDLTTRGRITLSSLEEHDGKQYIHWQRCLGTRRGEGYDSHYGTARVTDGIDGTPDASGPEVPGMGSPLVTAPPMSGVMFVEINYDYRPVIASVWLPAAASRLHYVASFVVRDRRIFDQIYNPQPGATRYTCDRYTAA